MELRYTVLSDGTMSSREWLMRNPDLATQWAVKMAETYLKIKGDRTQIVFLGDTDCGARPHEPSTHPPGAPDTHSHETTDAATFHTANAGNQVGDQRATSMAFT